MLYNENINKFFAIQNGINLAFFQSEPFDISNGIRYDCYKLLTVTENKELKNDLVLEQISALKIDRNLRFSNSIIQLANAINFAKINHIKRIYTPNFWYLNQQVETNTGISIINNAEYDFNKNKENIILEGTFFYTHTLSPLFDNKITKYEAIKSIYKENFRFSSDNIDLDEQDLVIHIRSGDIFNIGGTHTGYGQPPLCFYQKIIISNNWASISLVFENNANPIITPLIEYSKKNCSKVNLISGDLKSDIDYLLKAKTLVVSRGSFASGITVLSTNLKTVFFFDSLYETWGNNITVHKLSDVQGDYKKDILSNNWKNTEAQQKLMLEYPISAINFHKKMYKRTENHFNQYGITKELLWPDYNYDDLLTNEENSTELEITEAINHLVPQNSGYELIRIGGHGDGGYLVPDDLMGIEACFSPGVSNFKNFEDQLATRYGIKSFMCDYTSDLEKLRTPLISGLQYFEKKWLDVLVDVDNLDINKWVLSNTTPGSDLILQIDIEGAEYRNLLNASMETLGRFRMIIIEIHGLNLLGESSFLNGIFMPVINKIMKLFTCVHAHPNNCCGFTSYGTELNVPNIIEVTFLRNDRVKNSDLGVVLPHPLDEDNVRIKSPLYLDGIWLKNADKVTSELVALRQKVNWLQEQLFETNKIRQEMQTKLNAYDEQIYSNLARKYNELTNIAKGKIASQSSLSIYSTIEGASGAINGNKTGRFGFHTDYEDNPWWMVDLEGVYNLSAIIVYNRMDGCPERSNTLKVSTSIDGVNWILIYDHEGRRPFGGLKLINQAPPLLIELSYTKASFIKLECVGKVFFHLDEVEVFGEIAE